MNSYFFNINKIQNQVIKYMPKKYQGEPYNRITAQELYDLIKSDQIRIIDVRELSEYNSGHIKESELISLNHIEDWVKDNEINQKLDKGVIMLTLTRHCKDRAIERGISFSIFWK